MNGQIKDAEDKKQWSWKLAKFIDELTHYISVEVDADADVETGNWGLPVIVSALEKCPSV